MQIFLSHRLTVFCAASVLALGGCASHHVASNQTRPNAASGSPSGKIPTQGSTRHSQYVEGHGVGGANGEEYSVPTGSHIPRHYNRRGYTTDAADPAFVYDENDIRVQSQDNISDQLRTVPGVGARGGR